MSDSVIQVEKLSKRFEIGERENYATFRDAIARKLAAPFRTEVSANGNGSRGANVLWALRDVSFEVRQGEVVGLIGRNGAGKSTLLKILARITRPTTGWARVRGRIGSLLEVGTGFHPELTGRENVFLSGAVLGMKKAEIQKKFDEIVAFSEVERFLDTPLKRYSSGMQMRLAFAVAAHLEPEILLVDEVLAVGDASFQKNCLGKMQDVSKTGRTIVFVSHNMAAIKALCGRALLLNEGRVIANGAIAEVIEQYLQNALPTTRNSDWRNSSEAAQNGIRLCHVNVAPPENQSEITIDTGAQIEIGFENLHKNINLGCTVYISNRDGFLIFESGHIITSYHDSRCGIYRLKGVIPQHLLNAGRYFVDVVVGKDQRYQLFRMNSVVSFDVENTATGRGHNMTVAPGVVRPLLAWGHSFQEEFTVQSNYD
jgi:lipopolysaccharide transport system ATP-binding protein